MRSHPLQKRSKRILAATLAAAGVIAVAGTAYAVYSTEKESSAIAAESNAIQELVLTGAVTDTSLWPNQASALSAPHLFGGAGCFRCCC